MALDVLEQEAPSHGERDGESANATKSPASTDQVTRNGRSLIRSLQTLWHRLVVGPATRLVEEIVLRRQAERLYLVFGGHIFFQTLRTAVRLDLFSVLANKGALTKRQVANHLGIEEQPARILLLGLTSCGLLRKRGDKYKNSYLAQRLFVKDTPQNIISYVELQHQAMYKAMHSMYDSVRTFRNIGLRELAGDEPTIYERLAHSPELELIFQKAMHELSVQANKALCRFVDFSNVGHLVDVGGGDATNIIELATLWPHLRASVFDLPSVCQIAEANINDCPCPERLSAISGNCFADPFPEGADCFLFSHFLTIWSAAKNQLLLRKTFDALPSRGQVIIFNMMQHDDETGPLSAAVGSPYFLTLATGEGMLYTWREYETWLRNAGFSDIKRYKLPRDHGAIIGIKR